jgi:hypothetical protein
MARINVENRIRKIILRIIVFAIFVFGVCLSFDRAMFSKLFLRFSFNFWPEKRSAILFFAVNLSLMCLYVSATYYALKTFVWVQQKG